MSTNATLNINIKKRNRLFGGIAAGSYSTLETKSLQEIQFSFQQRTVLRQKADVDAGKCRHNYRIIFGDNPFYELAYSNDKASLEANEWRYVKSLFLPTTWKGSTRRWVVAHFRQMSPDEKCHDDDEEDDTVDASVDSTSEPLPADYNTDDKGGVAGSSCSNDTSQMDGTSTSNSNSNISGESGSDSGIFNASGEKKSASSSSITTTTSSSSKRSDINDQDDGDANASDCKSKNKRTSIKLRTKASLGSRSMSGAVSILPSREIPTNGVTINSFQGYWQAALAVNVFCLLLRESAWYTFGLALLVMNIFMYRLYTRLPRTIYWAVPPRRERSSSSSEARVHASSEQSGPKAEPKCMATAAHSPPAPSDTAPATGSSTFRKGVHSSRATASGSSPSPNPSPCTLGDLFASKSLPFAEEGGEAAPKFTWSHTNADFLVRQIGNKKRKKKASSAPPLYDCVGADLFSSKKKLCHIFSKMKIPDTLKRESLCGVPTVFVVNFQVPSYIRLRSPYDGEGYSLVLYFVMNQRGRDQLQNNLSPGAVLLKEFIANWKPIKGNYHRRLKCIPTVRNPSDLSLGAFLTSMQKQYDAVPFLTGPKYHTFHEGRGYLEVDVDFHRYIFLARQVCCQAVDVVPDMVCDLAFVIQGETDSELPEQVLGSVRLNHVNLKLAQRISI